METSDTRTASGQDLFTRKILLWAGCFDGDRDFHVSRNDFALTADRCSSDAGLPGDAELAVQIRETLRKVWDTAVSPEGRYDKHGASLNDVVDSMRQVLATPDHPATATFIEFTQLCFRLWDTDSDGYISEAEFVTHWHGALLVAPQAALAAFRHADRDDDGRITVEDLLGVSFEFLSTTDPTSPAASLLGRIHDS
ncbi:EF-hand domain-containing protein [Streptomyces sp. NPDC047976]|uniref:EF-hand domain-containing protein n=1 Tax=Streptomyces sp. NPDC047976 TaxID=3155746 RepID=UPI00342098B7